MGRIQKLYKKQGGRELLAQWARAGVLSYAIGQILLTGFSDKSLEMLRNGVYLKIKNKLRKKYSKVLDDFDMRYEAGTSQGSPSTKVWVCWLQGMENAPSLVQKCYVSLKEHLNDREIILLSCKNRKKYVTLPDCIEDKYQKGEITHTHFSDILRIWLLAKYGGTWIDATVFCSGGEIPRYMTDSDFFIFQNLKPGADGHVLNLSSWFMTAKAGNKFVLAVQTLLYAYWEKSDRLIDYFLLHHFFSIVSERYNEEWKRIIQYPNSLPHVLLLNLFEPYNEEQWNELRRVCPFHKLAYKRTEEEFASKGTYYDKIFNVI